MIRERYQTSGSTVFSCEAIEEKAVVGARIGEAERRKQIKIQNLTDRAGEKINNSRFYAFLGASCIIAGAVLSYFNPEKTKNDFNLSAVGVPCAGVALALNSYRYKKGATDLEREIGDKY